MLLYTYIYPYLKLFVIERSSGRRRDRRTWLLIIQIYTHEWCPSSLEIESDCRNNYGEVLIFLYYLSIYDIDDDYLP